MTNDLRILYNRDMDSKNSKSIFVTGSDGLEYEYVNWNHLKNNRADEPLVERILSWTDASTNYYNHKIYLNAELIERIEEEIPNDYSYRNDNPRLKVLRTFRPPVLDLTVDDFFEFIHSEYSSLPKTPGRGLIGSSQLIPADSCGEYGNSCNSWRAINIANRSKFVRGILDPICRTLEIAWKPNVRSKPNFATEVIKLNHYIYGEGTTFDGTFREFMDLDEKEYSVEMIQDLTEFKFTELEEKTLFKLLLFIEMRSVGSFEGVSKKKRDLLFEQDQEMWRVIVEKGRLYKKGADFDGLTRFLADTEVKLGRKKGKGVKALTKAELKKEYILMMSRSIVSEKEDYNSELMCGLTKAANEIINRTSETLIEEHTKLIVSVQKIEQQTGRTVDLKQMLGLLSAQYSNTWIRSTGNKGVYLLHELLETNKSLDILSLIYELVYTEVSNIPTETEWRKTATENVFGVPAEMFLTLAVSPKAVSNMWRISYPIPIQVVRNLTIKKN